MTSTSTLIRSPMALLTNKSSLIVFPSSESLTASEFSKVKSVILSSSFFPSKSFKNANVMCCIFVNGKFDGFLWQFKDVTKQKKLEQELDTLHRPADIVCRYGGE